MQPPCQLHHIPEIARTSLRLHDEIVARRRDHCPFWGPPGGTMYPPARFSWVNRFKSNGLSDEYLLPRLKPEL